MDAVKYLKIKAKICRSIKDNDCKGCVLKGNAVLGCHTTERLHPEECVAQAEKWEAEHPKKTRQSEFLKMCPNAPMEDGRLDVCPGSVDTKWNCRAGLNRCNTCKQNYWISEVGL